MPRWPNWTLEERFWSKVEKTPTCWIWKAALNQTTHYGVFGMMTSKGWRMIDAPRVAYELAKGPIPEGKEPDHLCRNRQCVNPEHLEAVTHKMNCERGAWAMKTHCPKGHPYTKDNLRPTKLRLKGTRDCATCHRDRERERHRRNALVLKSP